jgi:hypothetical protein
VASQQIHHRLDLSAKPLAARLSIALLNFFVALFFSPSLFFASIYLFAPATRPTETLSMLIVALGSLAVVGFSTTTAIVALRRGCWRLKYQLCCLAGGAAMAVPSLLHWTP